MKKNKRIIFFILASVVATILLLFFYLPLVLPKTSETLFTGFEVFAVPYRAQITDGRVKKKIVWVESFTQEDLVPELLIAVNYRDSYWIEAIVEIDYMNEEVITSFDGTLARRYSFSDIAGIYNRQANFIGVFFYFASRIYGLVVITLAFSGSLYLGYRGFVKDARNHVKRSKDLSENEKTV